MEIKQIKPQEVHKKTRRTRGNTEIQLKVQLLVNY